MLQLIFGDTVMPYCDMTPPFYDLSAECQNEDLVALPTLSNFTP
jgi:hypothetical protein